VTSRRQPAQAASPVTRPFAVAAHALRHLPGQLVRRPRDAAQVGARVGAQALLRPLIFYAIVSVLIGYTVLYVISRVGGAGVRPDALIRQIGGSYVIALAPALSAILFVAASGSATNAWLGSMALGRQTLALEALGIDQKAYLWAPSWAALGLAYLAIAAVFALGMITGGYLVCRSLGMHDAWALLTAELIDPRPERAIYTARAMLLVWMYGWGIASDVVAKGTSAKPDADAVTRGMTASVVACTLWVVALELATVVWVLAR
jgi:ABC-type transporter Mla maintaining outer membrane lipid asymmetry permease subunit MlaE